MVVEKIKKSIDDALGKLGVEQEDFVVDLIADPLPERSGRQDTRRTWIVEHPSDLNHGDYSTNVALLVAQKQSANSHELADKIVKILRGKLPNGVDKVEVAGPGFINFFLSREFFVQSLADIAKIDKNFGKNSRLKGEKVMVEFTDPNPFKEFHIGHLMSNTIGEAVSRLIEFSGAEVKRVNYQGDVGVHVAKAVWGKLQKPELTWQDAYTLGSRLYKGRREEIDELNKKIYERSDTKVNKLYDEGRKESLDQFEQIYAILGTTFDEYFFESQAAVPGKQLVEEHKGDVFVESDGATVFSEEKSGLHTRVFLNSQGLPTYEAKELALAKLKYDWYPYNFSIIITGNEVDVYFQVLLKAMQLVYPELAEKTAHLSHGMLRLPSGKMSSRMGNVIKTLTLIGEVIERVLGRMEDKDKKIAEQVAVGAVKYEILKQSLGKDIVFDVEKSLSLEGDSGPYLQYTLVRAKSVLEKARNENLKAGVSKIPESVSVVEKLLYRFPEVVDQSSHEYMPHKVVHFLLEVASSFNSFYAKEKIVDKDDTYSPYKLALTEAVATTLNNGLSVLGIPSPERM